MGGNATFGATGYKMADDNKYSDDDKNPKKGEFRVPPRTWIVWIAIFGGIILLMLFKEKLDSPADTLSQFAFQQLVESNLITEATINYNPQSPLNEIVGKYYKDSDHRTTAAFRAKVKLTEKMEEALYSKPQFSPREPNTMLMSVAVSVLPFIIIAAL